MSLQTALVTGTASGVGRACADLLLAQGVRVVGFDILPSAPAAHADRFLGVVVDLADTGSTRRSVERAAGFLGGIDALFHFAAHWTGTRWDQLTEEEWDRVSEVNLRGTFFLVQAVGLHMRERGDGNIIMVGSGAIYVGGTVGSAAYVTTKAGTIGLMRTFARVLAPNGIRVNAVNPGVTASGITARWTDEERAAAARGTLVGRIASAADVARAAIALTGEDMRHVWGEVLEVTVAASFGRARAAVLVAPRTFQLRELELPEIGSEDGLLQVESCGLCGTDYEQFRGDMGWGGGMPIIPGHEVVGRIAKVGEQAARRWGVVPGDRVALESIIPCANCRACLTGGYTHCLNHTGYGLTLGTDYECGLWGGYATHVYLHPRAILHRLPNDVPADLMSLFNPLSNAIRWTWEVPQTAVGSTVVIAGPGQRGLCAVVAALEAGAETIIVTGTAKDAVRLELARALGATRTVDVSREDPVEVVRGLTGGAMADVVVDVASGSVQPVLDAVEICRPGGAVVLAGLKGQTPLDGLMLDRVVLKEIRLLGVLSSGFTSIETAISIIRRNRHPLDMLCTHSFRLEEAGDAVRTLGREYPSEREPVHVTLLPEDLGARHPSTATRPY